MGIKSVVRRLILVAVSVVLALTVVVVVYACNLGEVPFGAFRLGFRTFQPECILLSDTRIGEPLGVLEDDLSFKSVPYGRFTDASILIPAGTSYHTVEGFDREHYLALPYEGFYFLYSTDPSKRIVLEPLANDDALQDLREEYAGTQAQACYEVFTQVAGYQMSYCFLNIDGLHIDDPAALLRMITAYCDNRGIAILFPSDNDMLEERGYWQDHFYVDGLSISLSDFTIGTVEKPEPDGDSPIVDLTPTAYEGEVSVETGVVAGDLAGNGRIFALELRGGAWVVRESEMTWIS